VTKRTCGTAPGTECEWHEAEDVRRAALLKVARAAYALGAQDAQRLAAGIARDVRDERAADGDAEEKRGALADAEHAAAAAADEVLGGIERADLTRAEPDWSALVAAAMGEETP